MEVQITWVDQNGAEHKQSYLILNAVNNVHAIHKAIEYCLDDFDKDGKQIEKTIEKIEVIGYLLRR